MKNLRCKIISFGVMCVSLCVLAPCLLAQTEDLVWLAYLDGRKNHYYVDQQHFEDVACEVSVSMLEDLINKVDEQIGAFGENVRVHTDLSTFEIRYSPILGVRYTDPKFNIEVSSYEGVENVQRVRRGLGMIQQGFTFSVEGIKKQLTSIVNVSIKPQPNQYEDLEMMEVADGVEFKYAYSGFTATETRLENRIQVSQKNDLMSIKSDSEYESYTDDKLVLVKTTLDIGQAMGDISLIAHMSYQTVEDIIFLKTMKVAFEQGMPSTKTTGEYEVELKNCKVY